jgi:hypothetical protein
MNVTMTEIPKPLEWFQHHKGMCYQVLCLAKGDDMDTLNVIHRGPDGAIWTREIGNFMGLRDGVPRFRKIPEGEAPIEQREQGITYSGFSGDNSRSMHIEPSILCGTLLSVLKRQNIDCATVSVEDGKLRIGPPL